MEKYIYKALIEFDFTQKAVLCCQLEHQGSVPRKDYPVMLVLEKGPAIGTVGGGLLEHDSIELARQAMDDNQTIWRAFELTNKDPHQEGSICGGTSRVLIEPYTHTLQQLWQSMNLMNLEGTNGVLITTVNSKEPVRSSRYWVADDESMESLPPDLQSHARAARASGRSTAQVIGECYHLFQLISPIPILHIFGAGHVGRAVAELAHFAELDVIVYDDRPDLANPLYFPHARQIIVDDFSLMSDRAPITNRDFVLIMTRGHQHDLQLMQWLLKKQVHYLGLMSSERKWRLLSKQLLSKGYTKNVVDSVQAPVGLPIESETVPEIAVSIIAQIIQVQRTGKIPN